MYSSDIVRINQNKFLILSSADKIIYLFIFAFTFSFALNFTSEAIFYLCAILYVYFYFMNKKRCVHVTMKKTSLFLICLIYIDSATEKTKSPALLLNTK